MIILILSFRLKIKVSNRNSDSTRQLFGIDFIEFSMLQSFYFLPFLFAYHNTLMKRPKGYKLNYIVVNKIFRPIIVLFYI